MSAADPLLDRSDEFRHRHIGPSEDQQQAMLGELGYADIDAFMAAVVPPSIRDTDPLGIGPGVPEDEAQAELRRHAAANRVVKSFIGLGYHGTVTPPAIRRNVLENPGWYTAYTPYQPEISQGRLELLLAFQTMVAEITGMDVANASLLDEATAVAEAMALAHRVDRAKRSRVLIDRDALPQTVAVARTRAAPLELAVEVVDPINPVPLEGALALVVQYPGASGEVPDLPAIASRCKAAGVLLVVAADLLACQLLAPPGALGADIVVGSAQRFGVPMGFGGPHAAYMAVRTAHQRQMPGRLVGVSVDGAGRPALRLALQTREQHIRREKATSNVCTAQVLLAVMAALYAMYHGPDGLAR
ncbi:MAG: glycine dehydrogenase (aminomethyl-transferring), partial [Rhodospirillaceae bacterium]|nr:glycine dehydrogenase (aminomethyl-transferring) [Rhodospirillaceae bacterium]